jgi:hypothetical protein
MQNYVLFSCTCKPGYDGDGKECHLASKCPVDYCKNGGTCTLILGEPKCACTDKYLGKTCEVEKPTTGMCLFIKPFTMKALHVSLSENPLIKI